MFLRLRITQEVLQLPVSLSSFFSSVFLDRPTEAFFVFHLLLLQTRVTSIDRQMSYAFMSCALKINSNGGLKREDVQSYPSTFKNIIFSLSPKCL